MKNTKKKIVLLSILLVLSIVSFGLQLNFLIYRLSLNLVYDSAVTVTMCVFTLIAILSIVVMIISLTGKLKLFNLKSSTLFVINVVCLSCISISFIISLYLTLNNFITHFHPPGTPLSIISSASFASIIRSF